MVSSSRKAAPKMSSCIISAVEQSGIGNLAEGQKVSFDLERDSRGKISACNLKSA
jgi:cold shock protein